MWLLFVGRVFMIGIVRFGFGRGVIIFRSFIVIGV